MSPEENKLYDQIVHGLRSQGWSRQDAMDEAFNRIEKARQKKLENV